MANSLLQRVVYPVLRFLCLRLFPRWTDRVLFWACTDNEDMLTEEEIEWYEDQKFIGRFPKDLSHSYRFHGYGTDKDGQSVLLVQWPPPDPPLDTSRYQSRVVRRKRG